MKEKVNGYTRREVLIKAAMTAASTVFAAELSGCKRLVDAVLDKKDTEDEKPKSKPFPEYTWDTLPFEHERYDDVIDDVLPELDLLYGEMAERGDFERNEQETLWRRDFLIPKQYDLLKDTFKEALGKNYKPRKWRKAVDKHSKWTQEQKDLGNLIALEEDNPYLPYFAQQVGRGSGRTDNNPDMMFARKEFLPIMGTLVALVNYQIDIFNEDPAAYDRPIFTGNPIPHISAIKISGASRTLAHHASLGSMAAKTKPSAHVIGHALDIAALTPNDEEKYGDAFKVVRFVEPFILNGVEKIPPDGKLATTGFGIQTRVIISRMIGRALMSMEKPLEDQEGITLRALWESTPLNWHLTMKPD